MTTIGDRNTALMLGRHFTYPDGYMGGFKRAPNGFRRIGDGVYRVAFLERATSTVYKIGDTWSNLNEAKTSQKLRRKSSRSLGFELRVPHTRAWYVGSTNPDGESNIINAQEFASGGKNTYCKAQDTWMDDHPCTCKRNVCYAKVLEAVSEWSGLDDIHCENVLIDKAGVFWLIDMGC